MRPVLCMITDRRRSGDAWRTELPRRVEAAAQAGIDLVQVRERDLDGGPLLRLVSDCVAAVGGTRSRVVVNDRLDVALAAGAHGVHLRGDSFSAARVRSVIGRRSFLVGRSVHSLGEAVAARPGVDYLLFGTVFQSSSKPDRGASGEAALRTVVNGTEVPTLAVGGISLDRMGSVAAAGAAGVAAIGLFADQPVDRLHELVEHACFMFDSQNGVP